MRSSRRLVRDGGLRARRSPSLELGCFAVGSGLHLVDQNGTKVMLIQADAGPPIASVATDNTQLYFVRQRKVERCTLPQAPCTPLLVTEAPATADIAANDAMAVDATHIYWGTMSGEIFRTPKPP